MPFCAFLFLFSFLVFLKAHPFSRSAFLPDSAKQRAPIHRKKKCVLYHSLLRVSAAPGLLSISQLPPEPPKPQLSHLAYLVDEQMDVVLDISFCLVRSQGSRCRLKILLLLTQAPPLAFSRFPSQNKLTNCQAL